MYYGVTLVRVLSKKKFVDTYVPPSYNENFLPTVLYEYKVRIAELPLLGRTRKKLSVLLLRIALRVIVSYKDFISVKTF